MSTVLVGFDFSTGSAYAVDLAIDIANRMQMDLMLVYVKTKDEDETPIRAEIERRNAGVAHLLNGIKMDYVIREGKVSQELCAQAKDCDAQLIIVGTHGMSGFEKNWIGRNTYRTIAESDVPVLTIREDFNFKKSLERIVVPIDNSSDTRQKVPVAAKFAKLFDSELHILGLYTSDNTSIRGIVDGYVHMVDKEYADSVDADMIVIMTEQESSLTSFLLGNYAQQMLTLSHRPVLSVRPEQVNSVSK